MNIAVIGGGKVGGALARKWGAAGHQVTVGARNPAKPEVQELLREIGGPAKATSVADAVADADVVLFAVPGGAMAEAVAALGTALDGKVVIDATNNLGGGAIDSVATIAAVAPGASVFRAFNTLGWENFAQPTFGGVSADLFYAGPAGDAQATVEQLIADVALRPIRVGGADKLPLLDSLLRLWFALASEQGMGRHLAFKVLTD
jgi:predicted dinucleotide-binding enzyme